jgi:serine/threonine protein kinase
MRTVVVPRYRALRLLHRRGEISVYDAWSEERACRCVLKCAAPGPRHAHERRALRREGQLLLSLSHPHIVRAYELLSHPSCALVLETLPGETLAYGIRAHGPLAPRDVARLGLQLCSALRYLHARATLHLDLKPSNVVCHGGIARLLDLGISRPPGPAPAGVGSPPYLAPEQARGDTLSPATDVFGLGALLYECLAGRAPFRRSTGRFYEQLRRRARLADSGAPVPAQLERIVDASLEPDPRSRPSLEDVVHALTR